MHDLPERRDAAAAFLEGDPDVLALVEDVVRRVVRSFQFGDRDLDRDLIQDVLSRLLMNLAGGRFRREASLETYARRIARYVCLEHIRKRRSEAAVDLESLPSRETWSAPEGSLLGEERRRRDLGAFTALSPECRDLLRLVCVEGLSYGEVARRLGISEAAVKSRIHRCRLACRDAAALGESAPRRARGKVRR